MKLKSYIWGMRFLTALAFFVLAAVLFYTDPETSGMSGKLIFYMVLFFFLSGFLNLFLLLVRRKMLGEDMPAGNIGLSFRQAILLSCLAIGLLLLQSFRMLFWWDGLLAVAGIFLIELYFLSKN